MGRWKVIAILGAAQFIMVLDTTVMNVSVSAVVEDLDTSINMVQLAEALLGELPGPPVKAMYVYNSNPAAVCPDQSRVW